MRRVKTSIWFAGVVLVCVPASGRLIAGQNAASAPPKQQWAQHDENRPKPAVIDAGTPSTQEKAGRAPSDAIVLFDGKELSQWRMEDGSAPKWKVVDGAIEVLPESGFLYSKQAFGDCQLHIEWMPPAPHGEKGQERGNSGVYVMGLFEIQVLDSYENPTYADGQAAAIYGQYPPLVNAMRPPGQWEVYDVIFHRPRFGAAGKVTARARMTVLHNGLLVQDNVELTGPTGNHVRPPYPKMEEKLPLGLQDHGDRVRFRNIWVRELPEPEPTLPITESGK
jgi:hypothetical protein